MAPRISSAKPIKTRPKVPSGTSVNEPGDGNSGEFHLSHRVHRLLPKSYPLGSVLASSGTFPCLQPRSEPLQEHLSGWGTNNSLALRTARSSLIVSIHTRADVKMTHQFSVGLE